MKQQHACLNCGQSHPRILVAANLSRVQCGTMEFAGTHKQMALHLGVLMDEIQCLRRRLSAMRAAAQAILDGYDNPERDAEFDWPVAAEALRAALAAAEGAPK